LCARRWRCGTGSHPPGSHDLQSARRLPGGLILERPASQGGIQLLTCGRAARTEDKVYTESFPPVVGRAVRDCGAVRHFQMKGHSAMRFRFVLPLPAFVLHLLTAVVVAAVHIYLAAGHL